MPSQPFRFWDCCIPRCSASAALDVGLCERCEQHFCAIHVSSPGHSCERDPLDDDAWTTAQTQELEALRRNVKDQALLQRASECNGGLPCELDASDPLGRAQMGGMHIHLRIQFSNGTNWLARILRQNFTSFADEFSNRVLETECATLKWLESVDVPAPRLHDYGLRNDPNNHVGVAYMLIDELPGIPLMNKNPSPEQLRKVYAQYADILCSLHRVPFLQIGCLTFGPNNDIRVGPIVGDRTGTFSEMGPFGNARDYYATFAHEYLEMICDGQLFSAYPVNAFLIFKYLKTLAEAGRWNAFDTSLDNGPFFLKHMDDKGDHILVDDEYNITGIIDWTFARVVPVFEAFGPSLLTAEMNDIFSGKPGPSCNDNIMAQAVKAKSNILAQFAAGSDLVRRFSFALGMGMNLMWDEARSVFHGIVSTATGIDLNLDWEDWRRNRICQWADDTWLRALLSKSGECWDYPKPVAEAKEHQPPRFKTCSMSDCTRAGVRGRSCAQCRRHLCAKHQSKQYHNCSSSWEVSDEAWEKSINDEVAELLSQINTWELVRVGTRLNNNINCKFQLGKHLGDGAIMGCANYHAWLNFDNGEKWIVRIPRTGFSDVPLELVEYLVASEYATLKFLESTNIPAPRVFGYGIACEPSNRVGVNYILMEALPGKPSDGHNVSPFQKKRVIEQVADIMLEIHKHPFPLAGSLTMKGEQIEVSSIASNRFVALNTYGPFVTPLEYILSITEQYMDLIADGQLHYKYPTEAFLFYDYLRRNAAAVVRTDTPERFFLKHVDDKGDHLLVDDDFNITGVIDWQFARIVPASEAFGPSYLTADLESLYSRNTGMTGDDKLLANALREKGAPELASFADGNEMMRRVHHGLASGLTTDEAREMLVGMVEAVSGQHVEDMDLWVKEQARECFRDPRWEKIQALAKEQMVIK